MLVSVCLFFLECPRGSVVGAEAAVCEREATEVWSLLRSVRLIRLMELVVPSFLVVCIVPARASRCDSSVLHSTSSSFDGISIAEAEVADECRLLDGRIIRHCTGIDSLTGQGTRLYMQMHTENVG